MNVKCVKLEDGIEYVVLDEIDAGANTYVYLSNVDNEEDFCIRKVNNSDENTLLGLDSDDEFDEALLLYTKKYQ